MYIIGDVIDRGPDSISILKDIMARPNVEMFLGNHELMMLDYFARTGSRPERWMLESNGGIVTFESLKNLKRKELAEIKRYFKNAWIQKYVEVGGVKYALHHSYWLEDYAGKDVRYSDLRRVQYQSVFKAVWYSPYRAFEYVPAEIYDDEYIHIIGHVPVQFVYGMEMLDPENAERDLKPPYIDADGRLYDIDGGCAMISRGRSGGLYCMSLETDPDGKRAEYWIE